MARRSSSSSSIGGFGTNSLETKGWREAGPSFPPAPCRKRKYPTEKMRGGEPKADLYSRHDNAKAIFLGSRRSPLRQVQREVPDRGVDHRHLLPAVLHSAPAEARQCADRPHRG